jgi:VWFA-related protein
MMRLVLSSVLCRALPILMLSMSAAAAQAPNVFHAETRLVVVQMSVHDDRGEPVAGLDQRAFTVYENGKPQPIALFFGDNVPVSVGIIIDNSGSMRARRSQVESAALTFARSSNPLDELFVVNFADMPHLDVPFTSDPRTLEAGIARSESIGGTALRDAVSLAEQYLHDHAKHDRKVLVVITDGNDNASTTPAERVRLQAQQGNIAIYVIALPHDDASKAAHARRELDDLTERTGGVALHIAQMQDVEPAALELARRIRQQYTLAYAPLNQLLDGTYRKIRVVVRSRERLSVRTRAGYLATEQVHNRQSGRGEP